MNKSNGKSLAALVCSMAIFGTVGIFSRYIPFSSSMLALSRAVIGAIFLAVLMAATGKMPDLALIKKNLLLLIISGVCLGANWILFFSACRKTTVASATLSYYLAPTLVVLIAAFVFREGLDRKKIVCSAAAFFGMVLVSGIIGGGVEGISAAGILLGLGAAGLYASVVIFNKLMRGIDAYSKTLAQFIAAALTLLPYVLLTERNTEISLDARSVIMLIVIGVLHTGIAYALYFGAAPNLSLATVAIYSYTDPIIALVLSAIVLKEKIGVAGVIGAILIVLSSLAIESDITLKNVNKGRENNEN